MEALNKNGMVLIGCGRMGSALLAAWLDTGLAHEAVTVVEPYPSDWLKEQAAKGLRLNADIPANPAVLILATKPQMMKEVMGQIEGDFADTLFISVAAGTPISFFEAELGADAKIVRVMPNTPALLKKGVSALVANKAAQGAPLAAAQDLMTAVGVVEILTDEEDIHAVIGLSGSGPAYVFAFVEALVAAGKDAGLEEDLAFRLARDTLVGAAAMIGDNFAEVATLRENVTSPGGTTAAALKVFAESEPNLNALVSAVVKASKDRSIELAEMA
ncbi:pyrroline-5-carboxylate reductase [Actibacterium pelagium]|uniref:Pyrroline-5-carboxylate reductase n=1 Tax=Actibacterium pelagium TaxID=2029103 RepID=A0A917AJ11_9RHOB|nr:pyrroline-5-carboxylate reductase [Actibacterium pelagium]GGE56837.1 pyrroline-5-carboxylate reductase [Actibacterium pelagium]